MRFSYLKALSRLALFVFLFVSCKFTSDSSEEQFLRFDADSCVAGLIFNYGVYMNDTVVQGDWEGQLNFEMAQGDTLVYDASNLFSRIGFEWCRTPVLIWDKNHALYSKPSFQLFEIDGTIDFKENYLDCLDELRISTSWKSDTMIFAMRIEVAGTTYYNSGKWLIDWP
jgi:hypothetical protein